MGSYLSMHRIEDLLLSILSNIISPLILFLLGSLVMKNNIISKFISKTYMSVKTGLELNIEEVPDVKEAEESKSDETLIIKECSAENYTESKILEKLSKNYGADNENGWEVRTYYTFTKKQLFDNELINFKVRDNKFNIYLKTVDLIEHFKLKNSEEQISDGAGKIRVYIFQTTNKENYIVRFGKKPLDKPIKISKL